MTSDLPPLLISLKPEYADLVFEGLKTAELRRRLGSDLKNRDVIVYVSSPVMAIRGGFQAGHVWSGSPEEVWTSVADLAGVSRAKFNSYYEGTNVAFALEIRDVWELARPVSLERLRNRNPNFVAPQSYRYLKSNEAKWLLNLARCRMTA